MTVTDYASMRGHPVNPPAGTPGPGGTVAPGGAFATNNATQMGGPPQMTQPAYTQYVAEKPQQSWVDWLTGKEPPKSAAEIRDENYAAYVVSLDRIFCEWESGKLTKEDALSQTEQTMVAITNIGTVDGERARLILARAGIDDQRRMDLEREYNALRKANSKTEMKFGAEQGEHENYTQKRTTGHNGKKFGCC